MGSAQLCAAQGIGSRAGLHHKACHSGWFCPGVEFMLHLAQFRGTGMMCWWHFGCKITWGRLICLFGFVGYASSFCWFLQKWCNLWQGLISDQMAYVNSPGLQIITCPFFGNSTFLFFSPLPFLISFSVLLRIFYHAQNFRVLLVFPSISLDWITSCAWQTLPSQVNLGFSISPTMSFLAQKFLIRNSLALKLKELTLQA